MVWPAIIAAGGALAGSIGGGVLGMLGQNSANAANMAMNQSQMNLQRELASLNVQLQHEAWTNQLQYRARDAMAAGIHPVFAMGASPINVGTIAGSINPAPAENSMTGFQNMGQDISRAAVAVMDHNERKAALELQARQIGLTEARQAAEIERTRAETDLALSQAARLRGQVGPPFPAFGQTSPGGGNTGQVVVGRQGAFEVDPVKVATAHPLDPATAAGPPAPSVKWHWSITGALQPMPAPNMKNEDEFLAPLMTRWLFTEAFPHGGVSASTQQAVLSQIKSRYPKAVGVEWDAKAFGYKPLFPEDVARARARAQRYSGMSTFHGAP